jgi:hypothetical protein
MSQLGMGVLLNVLTASADPVAAARVFGKRITQIEFSSEVLVISVDDGHSVRITDEGQSCCESRYMTCDDDLATYVGATLVSMDLEDGSDGDVGEYGDCHEQMFLRISTDLGTIVVCTHNEHNGYYGGFALTALVTAPDGKEGV